MIYNISSLWKYVTFLLVTVYNNSLNLYCILINIRDVRLIKKLCFCGKCVNDTIVIMIMDDILSFKEKHIQISSSQINDLLQKQVELIDDVKHKQDHQCNENEIKIQELTLKVTSMKEDLRHEKQALEYKNNDLSKHLDYIAKLVAEKKKFLEENQSLELERNKLKICKRNIRDQELLTRGGRKFKLYRKLTRLRWDYEKINEYVTGYVTDKKKYIQHFCYKNKNMTELDQLLWQEIYQSTIETENKENVEENII